MSRTSRAGVPGLHDVARLAGVSHQTVSRVLNDRPHVREATRERVEQAVRELGYRPNVAARTLVTKQATTLGIIAVRTTFFGPASLLAAIEQAARGEGWFVSIVSLHDLDGPALAAALDQLQRLAVAGVVVIAPQRAATEELRKRPPLVPVVAVDGGLEADLPVVCVDQAAGARLLTEHLLDLGHATVHHVAGPEDWLEAEQRVAGWAEALQLAGARVVEPVRGDWSPRSGYQAGLRLALDPAVTAVFAANDQMALGVVRALQDSGRAVPGEVSVVGFDDIPEAEFVGPGLTTIRQNFAEVGRRSITHLLALVRGEQPPDDGVVAPQLVVRASTAAPEPTTAPTTSAPPGTPGPDERTSAA